jgi:hypothetical protein
MSLADSYPGVPRNTIDWVHAKIHGKKSYNSSHAVSVGTGTNVTVMFTVPAGEEWHVSPSIEATNSGTWTFSKAPNASGGSALATINMHSEGSVGSGFTHTVTYTSSGTILENHCIGTAGQGNSSGGGNGASRHEWIFEGGDVGLVRFVALNAATNVAVNITHYLGDD